MRTKRKQIDHNQSIRDLGARHRLDYEQFQDEIRGWAMLCIELHHSEKYHIRREIRLVQRKAWKSAKHVRNLS